MNCPSCSSENQANAAFCRSCGKALNAPSQGEEKTEKQSLKAKLSNEKIVAFIEEYVEDRPVIPMVASGLLVLGVLLPWASMPWESLTGFHYFWGIVVFIIGVAQLIAYGYELLSKPDPNTRFRFCFGNSVAALIAFIGTCLGFQTDSGNLLTPGVGLYVSLLGSVVALASAGFRTYELWRTGKVQLAVSGPDSRSPGASSKYKAKGSQADEIQKLGNLKQQGLISDEEFEAQKKKIFGDS